MLHSEHEDCQVNPNRCDLYYSGTMPICGGYRVTSALLVVSALQYCRCHC